MDGRAAVRTLLLKDLTADGTVLAADRILLQTIRLQQGAPIDLIGEMRRTLRIGTEPTRRLLGLRKRKRHDLRTDRCLRLGLRLRKFDLELLAKLLDDLIVQLRAIALLEHGKSGLFATDFGCKHALGEPGITAGFLDLSADFWTQVDHGEYYALYGDSKQEGSYQQLSTEISTSEH